MRTLFLTLFIVISIQAGRAAETFHCTHPQVCNLAKSLIRGPVSIKMIKGLEGLNPHHSSPSVSIYKKLKKAEGILFAPLEIEPWFKGFENKHRKSFRLKMEPEFAHFWLHPNSLCEAEKQLRSHFINFNLELLETSKGFCQKTVTKTKTSKLVVLTHESLNPLVKDMGYEVFVINTHDEHHDLSPKTLKKLTDKIKTQKEILWIIETQFHHPHAIMKMIKDSHRKLEINTIGMNGQTPDYVLNRILRFLESK